MQFGHLRSRGLVQVRVETQSGDDMVVSFATVGSVFFGIRNTNSHEYFQAKKLQPKISKELECRYSATLRENMRIVCGSKVFGILGIMDPDNNMKRRLLLFCEEIVQ